MLQRLSNQKNRECRITCLPDDCKQETSKCALPEHPETKWVRRGKHIRLRQVIERPQEEERGAPHQPAHEDRVDDDAQEHRESSQYYRAGEQTGTLRQKLLKLVGRGVGLLASRLDDAERQPVVIVKEMQYSLSYTERHKVAGEEQRLLVQPRPVAAEVGDPAQAAVWSARPQPYLTKQPPREDICEDRLECGEGEDVLDEALEARAGGARADVVLGYPQDDDREAA